MDRTAFSGGRPHRGPQGPGDAALAADHLAHIFRRHVELVDGGPVSLDLGHPHLVRAADEGTRDVFHQLFHVTPGPLPAPRAPGPWTPATCPAPRPGAATAER